MKIIHIPACIVLAGALCVGVARAENAAEKFFGGKNIDLIVGYGPGGGADAYTRAFAQFLGRHVPGNPNIVAQNMPGAASLQLVRFISSRARKDGTQLGVFNRALIVHSLLDPKLQVDFRRFSWIGSMTNDLTVCYTWKSKDIASIEELKRKAATIGATAVTSGGYIDASILRRVLGGGVHSVLGYSSAGDVWLAMERGEVDGYCGSWAGLKAQRSEWLKQGKIDLLVQFSAEAEPELGSTSRIVDLARSEAEREALIFLSATTPIHHPMIAPEEVPDDRVAALRTAFLRTVADPDFKSFAAKMNMHLGPTSGEDVSKIVNRIMATRSEAIEIAKQLLN